jgi:uncharacterized protein involved in type VI secretion and phage assembly
MFYGKYRGKVVKNDDPLKRGRIMPSVPAVLEGELTWAEPCVAYAGPKLGWFAVPPIGANVWVEFEAGDVNRPIWTGCFCGTTEAEGPPPDATEGEAADRKVFQTDKIGLIFDDKAQKLTVKVVTDDAGTMKIEIDKSGILLSADAKVTVTVSPDKAELKKTPCTVEIADTITLTKAAAKATIGDSVKLENGAASAELAAASIDLKNGASSVSMSPAAVNINNGALEVI